MTRTIRIGALVCILAVIGMIPGHRAAQAANMATLSVDFSWEGIPACSSVSPAFTIGDIPAGTTMLSFWLTDLDVPTFRHGGGVVAYAGSGRIPAGAFSYTGPCPPAGAHHHYQWDVKAIDASGRTVIGEGSAMRLFPPR